MTTGRTTHTPATLLQLCGAGDQSAFRLVYDLYAARLYGVALRITCDAAEAADAVHDTFASVWRYAGRFDPERGSAEAWLVSILRYRALDLARRRPREAAASAQSAEAPDDDSDALARLLESERGAALHRCLEDLDPERRTLIVHCFLEGLTHGELAARFSLPVGMVKSSIRRGLASLRACLEP